MNAAGAPQVLESRSTVLVVEDEAETRDRFGEWLEDAGYTVSSCPGPVLAGHPCLGVRDLPCPLGHAADIVLLDSRRLTGVGQKEKPGWRLLRYYLKGGKPIVVIADRYRPDRKFRPEQVTVLSSDPGRESILLAVRRMLRESRRW
jgi:CheY-like chemotaxis protein